MVPTWTGAEELYSWFPYGQEGLKGVMLTWVNHGSHMDRTELYLRFPHGLKGVILMVPTWTGETKESYAHMGKPWFPHEPEGLKGVMLMVPTLSNKHNSSNRPNTSWLT